MTGTDNTGGLLAALSDELANAVERGSRSVVAVHGRRQGAASGIVWPGGGVVVTADHVLERDEGVTVTLPDEKEIEATVAGRDPGSDVAVLRIGGQAPAAELAPNGATKVGHLVLALGRPGPGPAMASFGVVSGTGGRWRTARGGVIEGYVRADVTLYPGFSGGPLVDTQGRVVGMNSFYFARGQELAIPAHTLGGIVQTLLSHGRVRRAYLGVTTQRVPLPQAGRDRLKLDQEVGLIVIGAEPDSPADKGGLVIGDVLLAVGANAVTDARELQAALGPEVVGKPTVLTVLRGGERKEISVTPVERK